MVLTFATTHPRLVCAAMLAGLFAAVLVPPRLWLLLAAVLAFAAAAAFAQARRTGTLDLPRMQPTAAE